MSVFRELFVEIPLAILEGAVREAKCKGLRGDLSPAKPWLSRDTLEWMCRRTAECHGHTWTFHSTQSDARDQNMLVWVRLRCGHAGLFVLDELALVRGSRRGVADYVIDKLDGPPERKCTCIEYAPPSSCTPGVCK